jgi:hypothetical protein
MFDCPIIFIYNFIHWHQAEESQYHSADQLDFALVSDSELEYVSTSHQLCHYLISDHCLEQTGLMTTCQPSPHISSSFVEQLEEQTLLQAQNPSDYTGVSHGSSHLARWDSDVHEHGMY